MYICNNGAVGMGYNNNGEDWAAECTQESENGKPSFGGRSLGGVSESSSKPGTYQIRTGREDSHKPNNSVGESFPSQSVSGKVISHLIEEARKQIAYHEQQADLLKERVKELEQINLDTE